MVMKIIVGFQRDSK